MRGRRGSGPGEAVVRRRAETSRAPGRRTLTGGLPPARSAENVADRAIEARGAGAPVDPNVRGKVEGELGADLGGVRVHTDARAATAAGELGAAAFTHR